MNVPGGVDAPSVESSCPFTSSFSSISTMDSFVGASWNEVTFSWSSFAEGKDPKKIGKP